jgi:hypothetical protein
MFKQDTRSVTFASSSAVLYISVENSGGNQDIGTGFHIGDGYVATARHVIEGNTIRCIGRNDTSAFRRQMPGGGTKLTSCHTPFQEAKFEGPFHHPNEQVDVSILKLPWQIEPTIQLSLSVDQLTEGELLMNEVLVMGYPPIPISSSPQIVIFRGDISAVITSYTENERHLVISGMARGGFSGAPIIHTSYPTTSYGMVTRALLNRDKATELGFICGVTPRAIFETIDAHKIYIRAIQKTYRGIIVQ